MTGLIADPGLQQAVLLHHVLIVLLVFFDFDLDDVVQVADINISVLLIDVDGLYKALLAVHLFDLFSRFFNSLSDSLSFL
jgi:hypothetical protein